MGTQGSISSYSQCWSEFSGNDSSLELLLMIVTLGNPNCDSQNDIATHNMDWQFSSWKASQESPAERKETQIFPWSRSIGPHTLAPVARSTLCSCSIEWVKSHWDGHVILYDQLPRRKAQLNILAHCVGIKILEEGHALPPQSNPYQFQSCPATLVVNGQRATTYLQETMHEVSRQQNKDAKTFAVLRNRSDATWESIDFSLLALPGNCWQLSNALQKSDNKWLA